MDTHIWETWTLISAASATRPQHVPNWRQTQTHTSWRVKAKLHKRVKSKLCPTVFLIWDQLWKVSFKLSFLRWSLVRPSRFYRKCVGSANLWESLLVHMVHHHNLMVEGHRGAPGAERKQTKIKCFIKPKLLQVCFPLVTVVSLTKTSVQVEPQIWEDMMMFSLQNQPEWGQILAIGLII